MISHIQFRGKLTTYSHQILVLIYNILRVDNDMNKSLQGSTVGDNTSDIFLIIRRFLFFNIVAFALYTLYTTFLLFLHSLQIIGFVGILKIDAGSSSDFITGAKLLSAEALFELFKSLNFAISITNVWILCCLAGRAFPSSPNVVIFSCSSPFTLIDVDYSTFVSQISVTITLFVNSLTFANSPRKTYCSDCGVCGGVSIFPRRLPNVAKVCLDCG